MSHYFSWKLISGGIAGATASLLCAIPVFAQAPIPPVPILDGITPVVISNSVEVAVDQYPESDQPGAFVPISTIFNSSADACGTPACGDTSCGGCATSDCNSCCNLFNWGYPINAQAAGAYKGVFFANDFSYLCDPNYSGWHLGENMKRIGVGNCGVLDIGGEYRARYHNEQNMRGLGLTGVDDDFLLHRLRLYANYEMNDRVRFYAESIHAVSEFETNNPRPIEEDYFDLLNLFVDVKLLESCNGEIWGRYGRQELSYGTQRTVSPLDWANTRRTFEGAKVYYQGTNWDIDGFAVRAVAPNTTEFDKPNYDTAFYGMYSTYSGFQDASLELYWLGLEDDRNNANVNPFQYHTFGSRLSGNRCGWLYDFEGAYQTGVFRNNDHSAGAFTLGLGRQLSSRCWKPTVWAYYDWASGDNIIGNGYHHQNPLAHKYLGFMDLFGRRNIEDLNFLATASPTKRLKLTTWYHIFNRQNSNDVPYNVNMTPFNGSTDTSGGRDLGQELDLVGSYKISTRSNVALGYSHFWSGSFYKENASAPFSGDADFFWAHYSVRF
ncbi:MAG: hypothetical protein COA78_04595 [Blastopirellula sp.]|nr:MAG: hypothetical protein COA78_04595 [Blastopirellula sp.]